MRRIDALPRPPSRKPRPRSARIPDRVLRRYELVLERLRDRRLELGLTQEQVGERLGVSGPHYSNWERGYSVISLPKMIALADALRLPVEKLLRR